MGRKQVYSDNMVQEIIEKKRAGRSTKQLAQEYGVARSSIVGWLNKTRKELNIMEKKETENLMVQQLKSENVSLKRDNEKIRLQFQILDETIKFEQRMQQLKNRMSEYR